MSILPTWLMPSSENHTMSVAYGAVAHITGLDRLLSGFGAPTGVHWALAGVGADYQYRGFQADQRLAMCTAGGYVGGMAASMLFG
jgi:hypothetical protein